jgi:hypothetical protein
MPEECYIVRVYRRLPNRVGSMVGSVEIVATGHLKRFSKVDELAQIIVNACPKPSRPGRGAVSRTPGKP